MIRRFDEHYVTTLKRVYDAERQQLPVLDAVTAKLARSRSWTTSARQFRRDAESQAERLEAIFGALYQKPVAEPCWAAAALLRETVDTATLDDEVMLVSAVAAALLGFKRLEITRYEALMRWSVDIGLVEAVPLLGRSLAEEMVAADVLTAFAFEHTAPAIIGSAPSRAAPPSKIDISAIGRAGAKQRLC